MSPVECLKKVLNPKIIENGCTDTPSHLVVTIKEGNPKARGKAIQLYLPPEAIVFRLDMAPDSTFLLKSEFLNKSADMVHGGCDYVIFCKYLDKYWFVLVELKSNDTSGFPKQICCSAAFIRYLREIVYLYDGQADRYEIVNLLFSTKPQFSVKTPTKSGKTFMREFRKHEKASGIYYYGLPYSSPIKISQILDSEPLVRQKLDESLFFGPRCHSGQTSLSAL